MTQPWRCKTSWIIGIGGSLGLAHANTHFSLDAISLQIKAVTSRGTKNILQPIRAQLLLAEHPVRLRDESAQNLPKMSVYRGEEKQPEMIEFSQSNLGEKLAADLQAAAI
jgi:hypothetical protein